MYSIVFLWNVLKEGSSLRQTSLRQWWNHWIIWSTGRNHIKVSICQRLQLNTWQM